MFCKLIKYVYNITIYNVVRVRRKPFDCTWRTNSSRTGTAKGWPQFILLKYVSPAVTQTAGTATTALALLLAERARDLDRFSKTVPNEIVLLRFVRAAVRLFSRTTRKLTRAIAAKSRRRVFRTRQSECDGETTLWCSGKVSDTFETTINKQPESIIGGRLPRE